MAIQEYINLQELLHFHHIERSTIEDFTHTEIIQIIKINDKECIHCDHLERFERALRLNDLGINSAEIEVILNMRQQIVSLQTELEQLRLISTTVL